MSTIDIKPSPVMDFRQVSRDFLFYFQMQNVLDNKIVLIGGLYPDELTETENIR